MKTIGEIRRSQQTSRTQRDEISSHSACRKGIYPFIHPSSSCDSDGSVSMNADTSVPYPSRSNTVSMNVNADRVVRSVRSFICDRREINSVTVCGSVFMEPNARAADITAVWLTNGSSFINGMATVIMSGILQKRACAAQSATSVVRTSRIHLSVLSWSNEVGSAM